MLLKYIFLDTLRTPGLESSGREVPIQGFDQFHNTFDRNADITNSGIATRRPDQTGRNSAKFQWRVLVFNYCVAHIIFDGDL